MSDTHKIILRIAQNGMIAALYYGLTMLMAPTRHAEVRF